MLNYFAFKVSMITVLITIVGVALINIVMSKELKRIMFVTTLHLRLQKMGVLEKQGIHEINAILHLAHHDEALELPEKLYDFLWGQEQLKWVAEESIREQIQNGTIQNYDREWVSRFINITPRWMRYDRGEMFDDLVAIFTKTGSHTVA